MPESTQAEPAAAPTANLRLRDGGPRYTETPADPYAADAPYVAEPWNAVTASFFVFIAIAWLWRLRGRYRQFPFLLGCLPILLAGGVGGTLYHGLRTERFYFLLDVIPIQLLALGGSVFIAVGLWSRHRWLAPLGAAGLHLALAGLVVLLFEPVERINRQAVFGSLVLVGFLAALQFHSKWRPRIWTICGVLSIAIPVYLSASIALFTFVAPRGVQLAVNLNYASLAAIVVLPIVVRLVVTKFRHGPWFVAGVVAFAIAWTFRLIDEGIGLHLPMGSHWLWHTFGAISTALVIEYFHRVERESGIDRNARDRDPERGA